MSSEGPVDPLSQMDAEMGGVRFDPERLPEEARAFGLSVRSGDRTPAQNARAAHASPTSYHLGGTAYDFAGPPAAMASFAGYLRNNDGKNLAELYHGRIGWKNGRPARPIANHYNHVHVVVPQVPGK